MSRPESEVLSSAVATSIFTLPERRLFVPRPALGELGEAIFARLPVEVVRPEDLVHVTFSFLNLMPRADGDGGPPLLVRRRTNRPGFLVADFHSQHLTERALFETAAGYPVKPPPRPLGLPGGAPGPVEPDVGKTENEPKALPYPPLFASLSGSSRLVLRVTNHAIPYTVEGLLAAISYLDLSVAPHAVPPARRRMPHFEEILTGPGIDLATLFASAGRRRTNMKDVSAQLAAVSRMRATAAALEYRFGTEAAVSSFVGSSLGRRLVGKREIAGIGERIPIDLRPPLPAPPGDTHTSLELPWRLLVSPNEHGAFAHSPVAIEHEGRYELWHSRLGVRALDADGKPILDDEGRQTVDERKPDMRTIRAIWARDYEILPAAVPDPDFAFTSPPAGNNFPDAGGTQDQPPVRMALNSRDRMMLVHETANFHLRRNRRQSWIPEAVPTERLMLTSLGGWLDSRVQFETLPDGGLTIEEWKHRAALGRDYEVKVVYSGFLLPFGHRASLVKLTERKFADGPGGTTAYLFQRMFILVREPEKAFRTDTRALPDGRRLHLVMPFSTVRILTRTTPTLDLPQNLPKVAGGMLFQPYVLGAPFLFKLVAVDLEHNVVEFSAPLVFMERDHNDPADPPGPDPAPLGKALASYNTHPLVDREFDLRGQRVAFAESQASDDTILATRSLTFQVATASFLQSLAQDSPRFAPVLQEAKAVVPAMSALAGTATAARLGYPGHYAGNGFTGNAAQVFLEALDKPPLSFAGQSDRSGGLVTPSLNVSGLSRLTGPIGGDLQKAMTSPGQFSVGQYFEGISAKLFGLIPLAELFGALGFTQDRVPKFVTQALDVATTLQANVQRIRNAAQQHAGQLGAAANALKNSVDTLLSDLTLLASNPTSPPDLASDLNAIAGDLDPFIAAVAGAPEAALPQAQKQQLIGVAERIKDQLEGAGAAVAAATALVQAAQGLKLPEVIHARLDWATAIDPWPAPGNDAIFKPIGEGRLALAVEIQAPTKPGKQPSALVSCSITPFDLRLIGATTFLILHFETIEFSATTGKKPDVNVRFRETDGIEFAGPLEFVNRLKDVIPFDGFSDPPYLDVTAEGVKAGFDLAIPDLAVGVFALTNVSLGAHFRVPFVDESIETSFNFSTRENPFRLQVSLFAGGGFFGITITPERVRVLEAALEFGAAISVNFGVASGGVSAMAGVYFRLETTATSESAQLTGYFRLRGEVDVLGLISVSIELYLELTYETSTGKAVGRAKLTIEIEIAFFSTSVSISCEKKFAGSAGDPTFVAVMGLPPGAPPGATRPWDTYCRAFADD